MVKGELDTTCRKKYRLEEKTIILSFCEKIFQVIFFIVFGNKFDQVQNIQTALMEIDLLPVIAA